MVKIAITAWGDQISPVFDTANTLLVVEIEKNQVKNRHYFPLNNAKPQLLVEGLVEQEVSVLICGAISEFPAQLIENSPIKLIPFISGNIDEIIDGLTRGVHLRPAFLMPGCG